MSDSPSPARCRIESWSQAGARHALVMVELVGQPVPQTLAFRLETTPDGIVRAGHLILSGEAGPPILAGREDVLAAFPDAEPHPALLDLFGLPDRDASLLTEEVVGCLMGQESLALYGQGFRPSPFFEHLKDWHYDTPEDDDHFRIQTNQAIAETDGLAWGYLDYGFNAFLPADGEPPHLAPAPDGPPQGLIPLPAAPDGQPAEERLAALRALVAPALAAALAPCKALLAPAAARLLGPRYWTPRAHAFYAASGTTGARRRQAGALYPALAPILARDGALAALVDAGEPFEERLREVLAGFVAPRHAPGLTPGHVRRLRTLPGGIIFEHVAAAVAFGAQLPVDWLPRSPGEWRGFLAVLPGIADQVDTSGLRLADLLRPAAAGWAAFQGRCAERFGPDGSLSLLSALRHSRDPARRLYQTLVKPLAAVALEERGADFVGIPASPLLALCDRLLYGGKTVFGVVKLSERWHAQAHALELALPRRSEACAWPALFAPYRAPNGLDVVCLTSLRELADEGSPRPDDTGARGLDHCVGGYGRECWTGESHILSIRQPLPDGRYRRLSTVEIRFEPRDGREPTGVIAQHNGLRNGPPPAGAEEALEALHAAHDRGELPFAAAALARRDGKAFDDAHDHGPAALRQAFAAWAPFLPGDMAAAGIAALRAQVEGIVEEWLSSRYARHGAGAWEPDEALLLDESGDIAMGLDEEDDHEAEPCPF